MDLSNHMALTVALNSTTTQAFENQLPSNNVCGNLCGTLLPSTQASNQSLTDMVVISVCSFISLYAIKYPTLRYQFNQTQFMQMSHHCLILHPVQWKKVTTLVANTCQTARKSFSVYYFFLYI